MPGSGAQSASHRPFQTFPLLLLFVPLFFSSPTCFFGSLERRRRPTQTGQELTVAVQVQSWVVTENHPRLTLVRMCRREPMIAPQSIISHVRHLPVTTSSPSTPHYPSPFSGRCRSTEMDGDLRQAFSIASVIPVPSGSTNRCQSHSTTITVLCPILHNFVQQSSFINVSYPANDSTLCT
jgi:hypothetical protein